MKKIPKWLWVVIACSPIIVVALFYVIKFMLMLTYGAVAITDGLVSSYEKESEEKAVIESLAEKNKVYNNGNIDRVNYNNFTVSSDFPTLETNYAYYSKQGGGKHYFYCLSKDGERLLFSHESGGQVQVFDGYLYFTDGDSLIEYCFLNGEKKTVCDFEGYTVDKYVILDGVAYLKLIQGEENLCIKSVNLKNSRVDSVADNVHSIGVLNGKFVYLVENSRILTLYRYDLSTGNSEFLTDLDAELEEKEFFKPSVSFTKDFVFVVADADDYSKIIVFDINGKIRHVKKVNRMYTCVAYENNLFFDGFSDDGDMCLYTLFADSGNITRIAEFEGYVDISAYSDDSVYVKSSDFNGVREYMLDGSFEDIFIAK